MSLTKTVMLTTAALMLLTGAGCKGEKHIVGTEGTAMTDKDQPGAGAPEDVAVEEVQSQFKAWQRVEEQLAKLKQVKLKWNKALLDDTQKEMLRKLIEAAGVMDELFLRQVALRNTQISADLEASKDPKAEVIRHYFNINFGPYDRLEEMRPFINVPYRFPGATFYPMNMKKDEFTKWVEEHPKDKKAFESNFTIITRDAEGGGLKAVPYSEHYKEHLEKAAELLKAAASLSESKSLAKFLRSRAKAFLSNDYYASDLDWMDVKDNLLDVTIGPYETYEDALFGYKAAFEAFICLKDPEASEKLGTIKGYIPEMEAALPMDEEYKKAGAKKETPIVVVDVIYTAGDAKAGIQSIAFNLPNDERVRDKKGSKKVMLRNLINAKYEGILVPISKMVVHPEQQANIDEDEFFNHVLLHEISHGIGPGFITKEGQKTEVRLELKETYSTIEETKADVLGMTNSVFLQEKGFYPEGTDRRMWVTFLASVFRSIRFGIDEAHGKANVIILNYLLEKGGYEYDQGTGTFKVNFEKVGAAATDLARELLTIEAKGDYEGARNLIEKYGVLTDVQEGVIAKVEGIPVDIEPIFDLDF